MSFLPRWTPNLSQSGVISWPSLVARVFQVLEWLQSLVARVFQVLEWLQLSSVPSVGSTALLQGSFRCLWSSWLWSSFPGSLVFSRMASYTGFSVNRVQARFCSCSSQIWICCQINATAMWLKVLPLVLGKFMLLSNTASWISVLRTIAYLNQLFQPVKTCSSFSAAILLMLSSIHP